MAVNRLPALDEHRALRFGAFAILYAAQGLPFGLFTVAIPAWLAAQGAAAAEIGTYLAIATLPWSAKLVAGPVMDRFTYLPMGRRRPWVLGAQLGIGLGALLLASVPDPSRLVLITAAGFAINAFAALQDVAVDGMAIDVLPERERARANAFMFGGQVVGSSGSASAGTYVLTHWGLPAVALLLFAAVAAILLVPLVLRERAGERLLPWSPGSASEHARALQVREWRPLAVDLVRALFLPMSVLLVAVESLQRASSGILSVVLPLVTVAELGWDTTAYGNWVAVAGLVSALVGIAVAPWVDLYGARGALALAIAGKVLVIGAVPLLQPLWVHEAFFVSVLFANAVLSQVVTVAIIALFMNVCAPRIAATQFAVYMASANLALSAGSGMAAGLDAYVDSPGLIFVAAGLNLLFLALWPLFSLARHRERLRDLGLTDARA